MKELEALLKESIARVCDIDPVTIRADARLVDLGVDSLASAEVLVDLEIRLGLQLPAGALRGLEHAATLWDIQQVLEVALERAQPRAAP